MKRQTPLNTANSYHIYSKSISHFQIFNTPVEYERFILLLQYYQFSRLKLSFSKFIRWTVTNNIPFAQAVTEAAKETSPSVDILAYCLMPTHFHLILSQTINNGIERFISKVCSSYSHYFNLRHNRKGPLWQNRFGNSRINNHQELLETSRYVHLNPATSYLVDRAENWVYSSFREYTRIIDPQFPCICHTKNILDSTTPEKYAAFVNNHVETQRA